MASFKSAFAAARKELGAGKTFEWNGKSYTTDLASDTKKAAPAVVTKSTKSPGPTVVRRGGADTRPKTGGTTTTAPGTTRRGGADTRPKTAAAPATTRRGGADTRPKDQKPTAMTTAPKQGPAAPAVKQPARPVSKTPTAAMTRQQAKAAGKPVSALGRLVEKFMAPKPKMVGDKPKTAFKTPNRADVGKKRK